MKLNGITICNLPDLQRNFDPLQAYAQLGEYLAFVKIHSQHLKLMLNGKAAEYLSKSFFCRYILEKAVLQDTLADNEKLPSANTASECFRKLLDTFMMEQTSKAYDDIPEETKAHWEVELYKGLYLEKLVHIVDDAGLKDTPEDARKAVVLLAICEMAEANALEYRFASAQKKAAETAAAQPFIAKDSLQLPVGVQPYRFMYHREDELAPGETIRTVQLFATGSMGTKKNAVIELYDQTSGKPVCSTALSAGECLYLTAAGERVIGFLPAKSEANGLCIQWSDGACRELAVHDDKDWKLSVQKVSCFAAAGRAEGFLMIRDGKVIPLYYKLFDEDQHRITMDMIHNAVEVAHDAAGYRILTADGRVISNAKQHNDSKKRAVSLLRGN